MASISWTGRLQTSHQPPRHAELLDYRGPRGQRRVAILGDYAYHLPKTDPKSKVLTTFLYEEDGTLNDAGAEWHLVETA